MRANWAIEFLSKVLYVANKRNIRKISPTCLYASHMTTLAVEGKKSAMMIFILADRKSANTFNLP